MSESEEIRCSEDYACSPRTKRKWNKVESGRIDPTYSAIFASRSFLILPSASSFACLHPEGYLRIEDPLDEASDNLQPPRFSLYFTEHPDNDGLDEEAELACLGSANFVVYDLTLLGTLVSCIIDVSKTGHCRWSYRCCANWLLRDGSASTFVSSKTSSGTSSTYDYDDNLCIPTPFVHWKIFHVNDRNIISNAAAANKFFRQNLTPQWYMLIVLDRFTHNIGRKTFVEPYPMDSLAEKGNADIYREQWTDAKMERVRR